MSATTLTFLGATGTVTGSKFLLTTGERRILLDCGMFQGEKSLRRRNWADFPVDPTTIGEVLLTHAHLDHCGYLPALVKQGFRGRILCTRYTGDLAAIVLRDAGHLQERDAEDAGRGGYSKHHPPLPLYGTADVEQTLPLLRTVEFDTEVDLGDGITARWTRAGHILGSASIRVSTPGGSVLVSGDLGRVDHPVLRPRDVPPGADTVLVESTYGDRRHPKPVNLPHEPLADAIRRTIERGGSVLVPAFAVDRTEVVLQTLGEMMRNERIPRVPVYVNSPMATAALDVYRGAADELRPDIDPERLLDVGELHAVRSAEESRVLTDTKHPPAIILSSSGMATGGRVLHHLAKMLPDARNTVVLTGYQAVGTRGRALREGARQLKIHGHYVGVRAEILSDDEFSVHADADQLLSWVAGLTPRPATVYCVHGEGGASESLAARIRDELGLNAVAATDGEVVLIDRGAEVSDPSSPTSDAGQRDSTADPAGGVGNGAGATTADLLSRVGTARIEGDLEAVTGAADEVVLSGTVTVRLQNLRPPT